MVIPHSLSLNHSPGRDNDPAIRFALNTIIFDSIFCLEHCQDNPTIITGITSSIPETPIPIPNDPANIYSPVIINATPFPSLAKNKQLRYDSKKLQVFSLSLHDINQALNSKKSTKIDINAIVPKEYHQYLPLFSEAIANSLPPRRYYDRRISLKEGFSPPFGPLYSLSHVELEELKRWSEESLSKGFIRASSLASSPILFVKKSDGSLPLCVDYRSLNEGTIKNRYPLPLIHKILNDLSKARWFAKLDVRGAHNLIRMPEGEEWKTAFRTQYGLYESLVVPFCLTNAHGDFQHFINHVLHPFLDEFCTAYLDDILIYSNNLDAHKLHVQQILELLTANGLHLKVEKCEFHQKEMKYLGLIITQNGIKMDPTKISDIQD
jgi:hypothetical protein